MGEDVIHETEHAAENSNVNPVRASECLHIGIPSQY